MRIAFVASEAVPFVKSGGLADVVGALPKALAARGHDVVVILPKYSSIDDARWGLQPFLNPLGVWMGDSEEWCGSSTETYAGVRFCFIQSDKYFDRHGLYHDAEFAITPDDSVSSPARRCSCAATWVSRPISCTRTTGRPRRPPPI